MKKNRQELIEIDSRKIPMFGFSSANTEYKKILFLGSRISKTSLDSGFYYRGRGSGQFWSIVGEIYSSDSLKEAIRLFRKKRLDIKGFIDILQEHGIVVNDIVGYCQCFGASDKDTINSRPNDGCDGFHDVPSLIKNADIIVVNGIGLGNNGKVVDNSARDLFCRYGFDRYVDQDNQKLCFVCFSGSRGSNQKKISSWKSAIGSVKKQQ